MQVSQQVKAAQVLYHAGLTSRTAVVEALDLFQDTFLDKVHAFLKHASTNTPDVSPEAEEFLHAVDESLDFFKNNSAVLLLYARKCRFSRKRALEADHFEAMYPLDAQVPMLASQDSIERLTLRRIANADWHPALVPAGLGRGPQRQVDSAEGRLRHKEIQDKAKAAKGLKMILDRAGEHAALHEEVAAMGAAHDLVMQALLTRGSASTIKRQVRIWERFEAWYEAQKILPHREILFEPPFYPLRQHVYDRYIIARVTAGCGVCGPDLIRAAVAWIQERLGLTGIGPKSRVFLAMRTQLLEREGRPAKEAQPVPLELIKLIEREILATEFCPAGKLLLGVFLCMILASLRFDDMIHVPVSSLHFKDGALRGIAWQTKVDRRRRGTHFAVPDVSLNGKEWLQPWWTWAQSVLDVNADFWLPKIKIRGAEVMLATDEPAERDATLRHLREVLQAIIDRHNRTFYDQPNQLINADAPRSLSWHSARCTMISWAGQAGRSPTEMLLQMHSRSPAMVEKYQRQRMAIPCRMVAELVQDLRTEDLRAAKAARRQAPLPPTSSGAAPSSSQEGPQAHVPAVSAGPSAESSGADGRSGDIELILDGIFEPAEAIGDSESLPQDDPATSSEEEDEEGDLSFWILKSAAEAGGGGACHHINFSFEPHRFACKRNPHDPDAVICVGAKPPPKARICKQCLAHRPDVAALVGSWGLKLS